MKFTVKKSTISGTVDIPGSKSHTIRALFFSSLADGISNVKKPLISQDALSALETCRAFGAQIEQTSEGYRVEGFGNTPQIPDNIIDVGNSGTTLRIATATAALCDGYTVFTGDHQIRSRPLNPLLDSLNELGAHAVTTKNNGKAPVIIKGKAAGGTTKLSAVTSQYLTALLMNAPLFEQDTTIELTLLNEAPYVDITLWWLDKLGITYTNNDYKTFHVPGKQKYNPFDETIPGDFSSATFFLVLAAISGGRIVLNNLDMTDPQGDREVVTILESMGAEVTIDEKSITIQGKALKGREIDMNAIPDALPAMAVAACFSEGETRLVNVPQARLKETDRIKVMHDELTKMGADVEELEDGLIIRQSDLRGTDVCGHHDHRIIMALAIAGLNISGETTIDTAESVAITFPDFAQLIVQCGGDISSTDE